MNRHKTTAILMAPFLAIAGYVISGYFFSNETPPANILQPVGNCQPSIKPCIVESDKLTIHINFAHSPTLQKEIPVSINSSTAIDDVLLAIGNEQVNTLPVQFRPFQFQPRENKTQYDKTQYDKTHYDKTQWQANILLNDSVNLKQLILRLVVTYKGVLYFAEIPVTS